MTTFILLQAKREISPLAILVSFRGRKYRRSIGESVAVRSWNSRTKQVRVLSGGSDEAASVNERLRLWRKAADNTVEHFMAYKAAPTTEEFFAYLDNERWGGRRLDTGFLIPYFDTFIARYEGVRSVSQIKHYRTCCKTLEEYELYRGRRLRFEDIDMDFYNRFTAWFNTKGHTLNYLGEKIKILKTVLNDARDIDHLHTSDAYRVKGFITPQDSPDTVYLSEEELMRMYRLEIDERTVKEVMSDTRPLNVGRKIAALRKARDMFLIGAFTGLRYSDYSRLVPENIKDGVIQIRNQKTGVTTSVPEHWVVKEIIDRGYDFTHPLWEQKLNDQIKDVARMAGITEGVLVSQNRGGKVVETVFPKYELVSSHTARRSFATNAYKAGIPSIAIMKITGHKRESTFMRYIRVSERENAEMLKSAAFFNRKDPPDVEPNEATTPKDE